MSKGKKNNKAFNNVRKSECGCGHDHSHEHEHDHHGHHHHDVSSVSGKKLYYVILLNIGITLVQIIGGLVAGSLALISDALHNFSDAIAIIISYAAIKIGEKPKSKRNTFGYKRAEILAAFINSSVLVAISVFLVIEAIHKFITPQNIDGGIVIIVAFVGLVANFASMKILETKESKNMNMKSAYLHMLTDMMTSLAVIIAGIFMVAFKWYWIDPVLTIVIAGYIMKETIKIIKESAEILMECTPDGVDVDELVKDIEKVDNLDNVHHVHTWSVTENDAYLEAHVDVKEDMKITETNNILEEIKKVAEKHGVGHVNIQFEMGCCVKKDMISRDCK